MPKNQQKPAKREPRKWAKKATNPYTAKSKETKVVAMAVAGFNNSQIASEVKLNRETVARILSQNEFDDLTAQLRSRAITEIGNDAVSQLRKLVQKGNARAILETLYGLRVLSKNTQFELKGGLERGERDYADTKVQFYYQYGRWPTKKECLEFEKTIEVEPLIKESAKKNLQ